MGSAQYKDPNYKYLYKNRNALSFVEGAIFMVPMVFPRKPEGNGLGTAFLASGFSRKKGGDRP